ncbi:ABC transporter permease [Cohnella algarum]|uniref:ABC transporter permease n=1 Tax=Cohnella algarum TaxID=2044859 RepID=UPI001967F1B7|nr:ABC transporter permease [Cohnella algarum]MBN2983803.1 ABC transporter permease [Cohnella algarum]
MIKLMELEWRKLERKKVIGELIIYWAILTFLPTFFLKVVFADLPTADFNQSYSNAMALMLPIQMGFVMFGASLINHVFIEEYKNKTIALSFGYPISRKRLVTAKAMFIVSAVFICTVISFALAGIATYALDRALGVIAGEPSLADIAVYAFRAIIHSLVVALSSLIPLFCFGLWRRAVVPTVIFAVAIIQLPTLLNLIQISVNPDAMYATLCLLGLVSAYLSVLTVNTLGDL